MDTSLLDMSLLDFFLTSLLSGVCGSLLMFFAMYSHCKYMFRRYFQAQDSVITTVELRKMMIDIQGMKIQISALQAAAYHHEVEEELK